jgi:hypothetical protein
VTKLFFVSSNTTQALTLMKAILRIGFLVCLRTNWFNFKCCEMNDNEINRCSGLYIVRLTSYSTSSQLEFSMRQKIFLSLLLTRSRVHLVHVAVYNRIVHEYSYLNRWEVVVVVVFIYWEQVQMCNNINNIQVQLQLFSHMSTQS